MVTHECFKALGDPVRQAIVDLLSQEPLNVSELVVHFEISRPAVSRHLRVLRETGLVSESKKGRERFYSVEGELLEAASEWLREAASGQGVEAEVRVEPPASSEAEAEWRQW